MSENISGRDLVRTGEVVTFITAQHGRREDRDRQAADKDQPERHEPWFLQP
jgi:hypothetical protein